jgi:hypothetical protein
MMAISFEVEEEERGEGGEESTKKKLANLI